MIIKKTILSVCLWTFPELIGLGGDFCDLVNRLDLNMLSLTSINEWSMEGPK